MLLTTRHLVKKLCLALNCQTVASVNMLPRAIITYTTSNECYTLMKAIFLFFFSSSFVLRHPCVKAPLAWPEPCSEHTPGPLKRDWDSFKLGMLHKGAACMTSPGQKKKSWRDVGYFLRDFAQSFAA